MINIVFVHDHMKIGGAEKALLNMIYALDHQKFKIYLLLFKTEGDYMDLLPPDVEVHRLTSESLSQCYKRGGIFSCIKGLVIRVLLRATIHDYSLNSILTGQLCRFPANVPCDVLIAFSHLCFTLSWVSRQKIKQKILFIHQAKFNVNYEKLLQKDIHRFKKIVCVSDAAKQYMDTRFFPFASKTVVIHSLLGPGRIKALSEYPMDIQMNHFSILTVARLTEEKGCQFIPWIAQRILSYGLQVYWYVIGDGELYKDIVSIIQKMSLQKNVILLGAKVNPYPFIKMCDIYVQPSVHEGYGLSLQEARILCKPIVATDIPAFKELIDSGVNGTLAELYSPSFFENKLNRPSDHGHIQETDCQDVYIHDFADAIMDLIRNQEKRNSYSEWLRNHPIETDSKEILKLDELFCEIAEKK